MKRFLGALALVLLGIVPLLGAYSSAPPVVMVYPLSVSGGANPEAGGNIAVLLAQGLAQRGITVKPAPPGTQRADYLTAAQKAGAEYYVTGFLTALGDEVSMIIQAVSTSSGSIIWSGTTVVKTYAEAGGQADTLAQAILRHAGRALASLDDPRPAESETPQPSRSDKGNEANLTGLGSLFRRKPKATPAPAAAPSPGPSGAATVAVGPAVPAGHKILVLRVTGEPDAALSDRAGRDVAAAAIAKGIAAQQLPVSAVDGIAHAADFCTSNAGTQGFFATTLSITRSDAGHPTGARVDVVRYDCAGTVVERRHGEASAGRTGIDTAIDRAATAAFANATR